MDSPRVGSDVDLDYRQAAQAGRNDGRTFWGRTLKILKGLGPVFWVTVVIPTAIATLYFGVFASDVYVSESRFVVKSPDKPAKSGLGILLNSAGFSNSGDEIYAAQEYVQSRDALRAVNEREAFRKAYSYPSISIFDRFDPMGMSGAFEDLYEYYRNKISVQHDTTSSITTLTVSAYDPQDARRFNEELLEMAEATVNKLNVRGRRDLIQFASAEVGQAKDQARRAALALSAYRNREGIVDPEKQAEVQLQMISKLQDEQIAVKAQLLQLRAFTPENPQIEVLSERMKGLDQEISDQMRNVVGNRKSLAANAVEYQRLILENEFADKQLASAMASLEEAQNEARRKQAYVERIVQPNLPDEAIEPRRMRGILSTFALGLVIWGISSMLIAGVKEHRGL